MIPIQSAKDPTLTVPKVMCIGPIGVGKTTVIQTLPGKKFAYIFDPNAVPSLEGADVDFLPFIPDITDLDLSVKPLKKDRPSDKTTRRPEPKTYVEWEKDFEARVSEGFFDQYDWICFDSLTTFSEIIMDRVQYLNNRLGKHPEQADYTAEMNTMKNVFRTATGLKSRLYCTGHTEIHRDDELGKTYAQIIMTGRNRIRIPMRFTQIYALDTDKDAKDKPIFTCHTVKDRWHPLVRTTVKGLAPVEDVTVNWDKSPVGQGLGGFVTKPSKRKLTVV